MAQAVTVLLFGPARDVAGRGSIAWAVPEDGIAARALVRSLGERYPRLRRTLETSRFLRNGRYLASLAVRLDPGDEFAVHPPYGGG
ncbi:MAG TPA: MoaD/ThiS family protein [Thermoplasmata archaeon]|nr:MoaD/ThiS family protein [Thermoplasmata archaeon]